MSNRKLEHLLRAPHTNASELTLESSEKLEHHFTDVKGYLVHICWPGNENVYELILCPFAPISLFHTHTQTQSSGETRLKSKDIR